MTVRQTFGAAAVAAGAMAVAGIPILVDPLHWAAGSDLAYLIPAFAGIGGALAGLLLRPALKRFRWSAGKSAFFGVAALIIAAPLGGLLLGLTQVDGVIIERLEGAFAGAVVGLAYLLQSAVTPAGLAAIGLHLGLIHLVATRINGRGQSISPPSAKAEDLCMRPKSPPSRG